MQDPQPLNKPNQIDRYVVQSHIVPFRYSQPSPIQFVVDGGTEYGWRFQRDLKDR